MQSNESGLNSFLQIRDAKNNSVIYVIPGSGCSGCISTIETMALQNPNSDSLYFVFTRINSLKIFKNRFQKIYESTNVIIDTTDKFKYQDEISEIYPVLYKKRGQSVEFVKYFQP